MTGNVMRAVGALLSVLRVLTGFLLIASVALNFANVIGRYFFSTSIYWAEEVMLFLMIGCVFLGNGIVAWSGRQIRMDVIVSMMPARVRDALYLTSELAFLVTGLLIITFSLPVVRELFLFDQRSQSAEIPLFIPQSLVPIGLAIMILMVVVRLVTGGDRGTPGSTGH